MPEKDNYECAKIVNGILAREYEYHGDIKTGIYHRFVDLDENEDQRELLKSEIHSLISLFEDALKELGDDISHVKDDKPYNQILDDKGGMSKEEAIKIIDDMYHDKIEVYGEGNVVHVNLIETVKYTNLEFASIRLLRELLSLEDDMDKIKKLLKELEDYNYKGNFDDVDFIQSIIQQFKELLGE